MVLAVINRLNSILVFGNIVFVMVSVIIFLVIINNTIGQASDGIEAFDNFWTYGTMRDTLYLACFCSAISILFSIIMLIRKIGKSSLAITILVPSVFIFLCAFSVLIISIP